MWMYREVKVVTLFVDWKLVEFLSLPSRQVANTQKKGAPRLFPLSFILSILFVFPRDTHVQSAPVWPALW